MCVDLLLGSLTLLALTFPGWWLGRAYQLPCPLLIGFLGGAVGWLAVIFGLQITVGHLGRAPLAVGWSIWTVAAVAQGYRIRRRSTPTRSSFDPFPLWLLLLIAPVFCAVGYRSVAHPLFGLDTGFRWGLLAELMWERASLEFYPPTIDDHFAVYVWPDGIPPLVSSLYFAVYSVAGRIAPTATAPLVLAQFALLLFGTGALARRFFPRETSHVAIALLGSTALAAWSVTMGQETGFTALATVAILLYLPVGPAEETRATIIASGTATAAVVLAREYGWALAAFTAALCLHRRLSCRSLVWLVGLVATLALPWYLRNWLLLGTPIPNVAAGGFFRVNDAHARLMTLYRENYNLLPQLRENPFVLFQNCAAVCLTGIAGALVYFRRARAVICAAILVVVLWIASVPHTAAGMVVSLRVLSPAVALLSIVGAAVVTARLRPSWRIGGFALGLVLSLDGALRALTLPNNTYTLPLHTWGNVDTALAVARDQPAYHEIAALTRHATVLGLGPNVYLAQLGVRVLPPWSPSLAFLFDARIPVETARERLRAAGIRYVLVAKGRLNQSYLSQAPVLAAATTREMPLILERANLLLFELLEPRMAPSP